MIDLELWLGGRPVAHTVTGARGAKVRIVYENSIAEHRGAEVPLLSCSLPTPGPSQPGKARAFLEGLLPEGRALAMAAGRVRGVRLAGDGSPETPADAVALLAEYGRECAGAVVIVPSGEAPSDEGDYERLDDEELARRVQALPDRPLGADPEHGIRMSLAGVQDKLLLARFDGQWFQPRNGAASTHILKVSSDWPGSAENEAVVLGLAQRIGLSQGTVHVERVGDTDVLVVPRYDRQVDGPGRVRRLHQEDMCQAVGIRPRDKYHIGRPSKRMASVLREWADSPSREIARLFEQVAFRAVVGDEDGHGKNYSLMLDDGTVRMAPLYDSLCTLIYPDLTGRMGTPIGDQQNLARVDRAALVAEARAMGMTASQANESVDDLAAGLRTALDAAGRSAPEGGVREQVVRIITQRVDRLESGRPLGEPR